MLNNLENYCIEHSQQESDLQKAIREYTYKNERYPQMISGILVGNFLHSLIIFSALCKLPSQFEPISATRKIFILRFKIEHIKIKIDLKKLS